MRTKCPGPPCCDQVAAERCIYRLRIGQGTGSSSPADRRELNVVFWAFMKPLTLDNEIEPEIQA
jgi:hypothetical protein